MCDDVIKLQKAFKNNPVIGYVNINHLGSKIDDLRDVCSKSSIVVLCIDKTKLDSSLDDSNRIRTHNHLVRKRTLNDLAKLAK